MIPSPGVVLDGLPSEHRQTDIATHLGLPPTDPAGGRLDRLRWSWQRGRAGRLINLSVDLSNMNLPRPFLFTDGVICVGVDWGNGNSDPVWSLAVEVPVPAWLERRWRRLDQAGRS